MARCCALWHYNYERDNSIFGEQDSRPIVALKIKMQLAEGQPYGFCRISAFDVLPDIARRSGGEFVGDVTFAQGTGVVLRDPNGVKYRLSVGTDGTLSAVKI